MSLWHPGYATVVLPDGLIPDGIKKPIWWWYCNGPGPLWGQVCLFGQAAALNTVHSATHGTQQMNRAQGTLHSWVIIGRAGKCFVAMLGSPTDQKNVKDKLPTPSPYGQRALHDYYRFLALKSSKTLSVTQALPLLNPLSQWVPTDGFTDECLLTGRKWYINQSGEN